MGYKLAGCEVLGCCEIDPRMNKVYIENHKPKYNYLMDIRDFNKIGEPQVQEYIEIKDDEGNIIDREPIPMKDLPKELPEKLYDLDILDGSPPCSTFSMAGQREDAWGKEKKFREGQKLQTLDDLLFILIETVSKLKPKVAIIENVEGLMLGNAWKYVQSIYKKFHEIGYKVKHWLLKGETMGVPQTRHRVFFVATRLDFDLDKIDMYFNYKPITYGEIKSKKGIPLSNKRTKTIELLNNVKYGEKDLSGSCMRLYNKNSFFNSIVLYDENVCSTIRAGAADYYRYGTNEQISKEDITLAQTFPQDYNYISDTISNVCYICGMSVPPIMIKRLVTRLIESGLFDYKLKENSNEQTRNS